MDTEALIGIVYNVALLLALGVLYDLLPVKPGVNSIIARVAVGVVLGAIGIVLMVTPWELAPGIFFDTRSILLSVTGLFFGLIPASVAAIFTAAFRLYQGGGGAGMGVAVILTSTAIGIGWRRWRGRWFTDFSWSELYGFGLLVHVVMLLCALLLPPAEIAGVLSRITLPVLLVYPIGTVLLGLLLARRDVRLKTELALAESERRFRQAVEEAPFPIAIHAEDGQILTLSHIWTEITGYALAEIPTIAAWTQRAYGPQQAQVQAEINSLYQLTHRKEAREFTITCKNGAQRVWEFSTTPLGRLADGRRVVISMAADVTERKAVEKELRENQAILQAAMDQSQAGIAIADIPDGRLRYVNSAGLLIRGEKREIIVNGVDLNQYVSTWQLLDLDGTPLKTEEVPLARAVMFGEECSKEFIVRRSDNEDRVVLANAGPIINDKGEQTAAIVIFLDITEQKRLAAENEKLTAQFYQRQKMESIGQLAGGVAHDFNNLLVPIIGYAELGMLKLTPADNLYGNFIQIKEAADRAASLTHQILAFSRQQILEMRVLNLNETISEFQKMLQRVIGEHIELKTHLAPELRFIRADQGQIEQILLNLAINARDAMSDGGKLTIETGNVFLDEAYVATHPEVRPGHYVMLTVSDTGHGIEPEIQQRIFEPFFTTKGRGEGTGLGLSTVFGIVKQHRGNIWVYSEPGYGTTFKIYLPATEDTDAPAQEQATPGPLHGVETIMVVEDEVNVRRLVCETLQSYGYHVLEADGPTQGLALAADNGHPIHLLLTDVIMPKMNGRELYQRLVQVRPDLRVLFMSGYTDNVIAHQGVLDEAVAFIQKPFAIRHLLHKVREVLA